MRLTCDRVVPVTCKHLERIISVTSMHGASAVNKTAKLWQSAEEFCRVDAKAIMERAFKGIGSRQPGQRSIMLYPQV